jgi:alpha-galactosidase
VKEVLADPKQVYPEYDPKEGYELAGFVWFQGFNDLVGSYPPADLAAGKKSSKDYSEYSRLLSCFIRDVRKDLSAPDLPFVIGVLGVGGDTANENTVAFRMSMAAPAETDEFKGTVANVFTATYWPTDIDAILAKSDPLKAEHAKKHKALKEQGMAREDQLKAEAALNEELRASVVKALTADELFLLDNGMSNQGFHYYGSAKFFGQIGKAFAEALVELKNGAATNP